MAEKSVRSFYEPILRFLKEMGGVGRRKEIIQRIIDERQFTDDELTAVTNSGMPRIPHNISWARYDLRLAHYVSSKSKRGIWELTDKGTQIDLSNLDSAKIAREVTEIWQATNQEQPTVDENRAEDSEVTAEVPAEQYRSQLLTILQKLTPAQFEKICGRVLTEIGFEEVKITGQSGDGGIDGIGLVKVNTLVKIPVLFQFKRYTGTVGPDVVRDFRGTMQGRAENGAIITTGTFTPAAEKEATREGVSTIDLVDGDALVDLFVEHNLGVTPVETYEVDEAFFDRFRD